MIASTEIHDVEVRVKVLMMRRWVVRMMHRWRELQRRQDGNGFSYPERIEWRKHVGKGKVVVDLYSLVALATPEKAAVVEHVFGERVERPEVALAGVAGLARYFDEAVV